jgi:hypothetical protein
MISNGQLLAGGQSARSSLADPNRARQLQTAQSVVAPLVDYDAQGRMDALSPEGRVKTFNPNGLLPRGGRNPVGLSMSEPETIEIAELAEGNPKVDLRRLKASSYQKE